MKIGVTLPNNWGVEEPSTLLALGPLAESLGFDSVWTMDHLLNIGRVRDRLEDRPYYHPLAILSHLSATTERITLGTSVMVLPYHDPVGLAKYAATLDAMSGGRLILGVGVGDCREEFAALGISMRHRGALTDESIAVMKDLWTNPDPSYRGGRYHFSDLKFSPRPVQKPHVPLWIGGASEAALSRTARTGDGWHPTSISPTDYADGRATVCSLAAEAGRDPASLVMSIRLDVDMRGEAGGESLDRLARDMDAFREAGAQHVVLSLGSGDVSRLEVKMGAIARHVMPAVR